VVDDTFFVDFDDDGIDDCKKRTVKRNFMSLFRDKRTSRAVAVVSVHLVTRDHLRGRAMHETKKTQWSAQITTKLRERFSTIYARHGHNQEALRQQYVDGDARRTRRIDFIFTLQARRTGDQETPPWASHDRTCGLTDLN
jgi:hypothetical protein